MFEDLIKYINKNRKKLEEFLPGNSLDKLIAARNNSELSECLLEEDKNGTRLIDLLITLPKSKALLLMLYKKIDSDDWYNVIIQKNSLGSNAVTVWLQNKCLPKKYFRLIIDKLPNFEAKLAVLSQSAECEEKFGKTRYSILTHRNVSLSKCLAVLKPYSDDEKVRAILALEGGYEQNLLLSKKTREKTDKLLQIIDDESLRTKLKDHKEKHYLKTKAAHFLGIKDKSAPPFVMEPSRIVKFEGMEVRLSFKLFNPILDGYIPTETFKKEFRKIKEAFKLVKLKDMTDPESYFYNYNHNKLIVFGGGSVEHAVTIGAINGFLIVGNRGDGKDPDAGCVIYELKKGLTEKDIKCFLKKRSLSEMNERIRKICKCNKNDELIKFASFPIKPQKYETCTIANKKAVISGLLPLLKYLDQPKKKGDDKSKISEDILEAAQAEYKRFTAYTRHAVLTEILNNLYQKRLNEDQLVETLADYCNQHSNATDPLALEIISRIINELPSYLKQDFNSRLFSRAVVLVSYIQEYGIEEPIPDIVVKASSEALVSINGSDRMSFSKSILKFLGKQFSEKESAKWCQEYFNFLIKQKMYDILSFHLLNISDELFYHILSKDNSKKFKKLIDFIESPQGDKVLKRIANLSLEYRKELLSNNTVEMIKKTKILDCMLKNFSEEEIFYYKSMRKKIKPREKIGHYSFIALPKGTTSEEKMNAEKEINHQKKRKKRDFK